MERLAGKIQTYAWGSKFSIPELMGVEPDGTHQAELWLGTHPAAPTKLARSGRLLEDHVGGPLPFLLKILASEAPLSIQVHPDQTQAIQGFERENALGIALTDSARTYKDANHKPELLCALGSFWALCGFRQSADMAALLTQLNLEHPITPHSTPDDIRAYVAHLFALPLDKQRHLAETVEFSAVGLVYDITTGAISDRVHVGEWLVRIAIHYPGDIGVVIAAMLNLVHLHAGEAIYLDAGNLHAYLYGTGIELMAASDNVVRGGLTPKHIDTSELVKILDTRPLADPVLWPIDDVDGWQIYTTPAADFNLRVAHVDAGKSIAWTAPSPEIVLCTSGSFDSPAGPIGPGEAAYIAAGESASLQSNDAGSTIYRAS